MNAGLPRMALLTAFVSLLAAGARGQAERSVDGRSETGSPAALQQSGLDDSWSAVEPDFSNRDSRTLQRRSTKNTSPVLAGKDDGSRHPWARTIGALAGVVGLIVLLAWGYRAMAGGSLPFAGKAKRPGLIEVISRAPLSARQSLCLVRVGPRLVLIGQSQDTLRALDVIDDADLAARLVGEAAGQRPDSSQNAFHACLEREANAYHEGRNDFDENIMPEERRIGDARRKVIETIGRIRRAVGQA